MYFLGKKPRGFQGSEDCRILSYVPQEMLSFTWNFPPSIPEIRFEHTWVVLRFAKRGASHTDVTLDQLGWRLGPAWTRGYAYFDVAWGAVLKQLHDRAAQIVAGCAARATPRRRR